MDEDLRFIRVAGQVFGRPLLIGIDEAETIGAYVRSRMEGAKPETNRFRGEEQRDEKSFEWKGYRLEKTVGIVSIMGELVSRGAWMGASSGLTSYEGIIAQVTNASQNEAVTSIILDINSPGGSALAMSDTARQIRQIAAGKRLVSVVNPLAASAAYGLATAADEIVIGESGMAGSIGVVIVHYDQSKRLENMGVKATLIHAGSRKVVGNPYAALSDEDRGILQQQTDQVMQNFVQLVSDHRPQLSSDAIFSMEAGVFSGREAVSLGLCDRIGTFESVLAELSRAPIGRSTAPRGRKSMADKTDVSANITLTEHEAAVAAARIEGRAAGSQEATVRLQTALGAEGVRGDAGRMAAALDLAVKSPTMSGEDVAAFVAANVAAAKPTDAETLDQQRAAGLAKPSPKPKADGGKSGWAATADIINRRRA